MCLRQRLPAPVVWLHLVTAAGGGSDVHLPAESQRAGDSSGHTFKYHGYFVVYIFRVKLVRVSFFLVELFPHPHLLRWLTFNLKRHLFLCGKKENKPICTNNVVFVFRVGQ